MGYEQKRTERGNVLFLILIAVALFAGLSYAVTQSTRGGGNADDETSLISSAALTQYPAGLSTTLLRMSFNGVTDSGALFNPPSDDSNCTLATNLGDCVFFSDGGGASYQLASSNVMDGGGSGTWVFNSDNEILNVGGDAGDGTTNETIAFLVDIRLSVCTKINTELGIGSTIPDEDDATYVINQDGIVAYVQDLTPAVINGTGGELAGQPFGCFEDSADGYVYYHTLSEN